MTPKKYKVWWPEQGQTIDDAQVFVCWDYECAAAQWADWYDNHSAEYMIVGGVEAWVQVQRDGDEIPKKVLVTGEMTRTYVGHVATV